MNAAAFFSDYDDIQVDIPLMFNPSQTNTFNAGKGEISGFELEPTAAPVDGLAARITAYLENYPREVVAGQDPEEVYDRYHTADYAVVSDGITLDRERLLAHIAPARRRTRCATRGPSWQRSWSYEHATAAPAAAGRAVQQRHGGCVERIEARLRPRGVAHPCGWCR